MQKKQKRITKKEIEEDIAMNGDKTAPMWLRIKDTDWPAYVRAMKDRNTNFGSLLRYIILDSKILPKRVLEITPLIVRDKEPKLKDLPTRNHTIYISAYKVRYLNKYFKKHELNLRKLVWEWLVKHGYTVAK